MNGRIIEIVQKGETRLGCDWSHIFMCIIMKLVSYIVGQSDIIPSPMHIDLSLTSNLEFTVAYSFIS